MEEFEKDARIKRLFKVVTRLESLARSPHTGKVPEDVRKQAVQARVDIRSIGKQLLGGGYHDQLPLIDEVPVRKVVQLR